MKLTLKNLKWLIIVGILPPLYYHIKSLVDNERKYLDWNDFIFWFIVSVTVTIVLSVIVFKEIEWLQKKLPWSKSVAKRITAEFFLTVATVLIGMFLLSQYTYSVHCDFAQEIVPYRAHIFEEFMTGLILWAILLSVTEGAYFFNEWKIGLILSEKLNKEKTESQLQALRNQANPHFLFNSLNVLSSLVHSDPDKAEEFINKFASVYRYVLNFQEKNLVTLKEEIDFLNSYFFLQKIRFKEGLNINMDIDKEYASYYILPFSLQFMVENAIKHNIVGKENPLQISIKIKDNKIYVVNNIQLRESADETTGMGLKNLKQRYFLLANTLPEYEEKNGEFMVCIPLIKPEKEKPVNTKKDEGCYYRRRKFCGRKA